MNFNFKIAFAVLVVQFFHLSLESTYTANPQPLLQKYNKSSNDVHI